VELFDYESEQRRNPCREDIAHHVIEADIKEDKDTPPHWPVLTIRLAKELLTETFFATHGESDV
jgi:hypothetical protein